MKDREADSPGRDAARGLPSSEEIGRDFWVTEYVTVTSTFVQFLSQYIKVFAIYLGIQGLALKFAFDENATDLLRDLLGGLAILCCLLLFVVVGFAEAMRKRLLARRSRALQELGVDIPDELISARWGSLVFSILNVLVLTGWSLLIWSGR
jgi:hypothetical protein